MGSSVSPTRRLAVCERDGWQCKMPECLCPDGRAVDPALPFQGDHLWRPSVDHIVPRARGGGNGDDNLRAAHWACNNEAARGMKLDLNAAVNLPRPRRPPPPPRPPHLTYRIGDLFPGDQGSRWS